ncbi:LPP20 family lipoprotein [bacterium]|nr:LPP20 family lipoprotein [bacterium]
MRFFYITLLSLLLFSCGTSDKISKKELPLFYKSGEHMKYPKSTYISASGEGKTLESAIQNSKYNISQKISSTISGTFVSEKKSFLENSQWKNKQKLTSSVVMTTEFKNGEIIDVIDNTKHNGKYYAFAVVSKERGFSYVRPKVEESKKRFNELKTLLEKALENQNRDDFENIYPKWVESASIYADVLAESRVYSPTDIEFENPFETLASMEGKFLNMIHNRLWLIHVVDATGNENKVVSEMLYSILKENNFKVQYLSSYIESPKTRVLFKDLKNFSNELPQEPTILISAELIQNTSSDKYLNYCKSGVKLTSFITNPSKQLLDLTSGDLEKTSTKKGNPSKEKACLESSQTLKPFLEKDLNDFLKNYK